MGCGEMLEPLPGASRVFQQLVFSSVLLNFLQVEKAALKEKAL